MEQKSESWYEWRQKGLGSSDAPIIMGVSPWSTPHQLWEQKTGKVKREFTSNWAMDRGNRLEPIARAKYEFECEHEAPPRLCIHPEHIWIRSSLDGYVEEKDIILEIKCPGKDDHEKAKNGEVPQKYWPQIQHQFLTIPRAKIAHYYSFDGEDGVRVEVERDSVYQEELFKAEQKFWKCIQSDTPPELCDRDFKKVRDPELEDWLNDYEQLMNNYRRLEKTIAEAKAKIFSHPDIEGRRTLVGGRWKIGITHRRGSIDYANIPILQGLDLEPWRKASSTYRTITGEE